MRYKVERASWLAHEAEELNLRGKLAELGVQFECRSAALM